MKGQLISIEFENPKCRTLKWKKGILKLKIPKRGNLCVSNGITAIGFADEQFYIVDTKNRKKIARVKEQIFNPEIKLLNVENRESVIFRFFYGTRESASKLNEA